MSKDECKAETTDVPSREHLIAILDIDRTSAVKIVYADDVDSAHSAYAMDAEFKPYLTHLDHRFKTEESLSVNVVFNTDRRLRASAKSMLRIFFSDEDDIHVPTTSMACLDLSSEVKKWDLSLPVSFLSSCDRGKDSFLQKLLIPFEQTLFLTLYCYAINRHGKRDHKSMTQLLSLIDEIEALPKSTTRARYRTCLFECVFGDIQSHVDAISTESPSLFMGFDTLLDKLGERLASGKRPRMLVEKIGDFLKALDPEMRRFFSRRMPDKFEDSEKALKPMSAALESFYMAVCCPKTAKNYQRLSIEVKQQGKIPSTLNHVKVAPDATVQVVQFDDSNAYLRASAAGSKKHRVIFTGLQWEQRLHPDPMVCIRMNAIRCIAYLCDGAVASKRLATPCLDCSKPSTSTTESTKNTTLAG